MRFFLILLFCFISVSGFAEVFVMPMDTPVSDSNKTEQAVYVKPEQDDEMLSSRQINEFIRYTICGTKITDVIWENTNPEDNKNTQNKNTTESTTSKDDNSLWNRYSQTVCGVYYASSGAAGKGLAVNAALKDLGDVSDLTIKEATVVKTNKNDFDIKDKKPVAVKGINEEGVYKKVLTSRKKIRLLYNYDSIALPWRINDLMNKRGSTALPVRITFYEDTSADNPPAYAVVVFKADRNNIADMYGKNISDDENKQVNSGVSDKTANKNNKESVNKNAKAKSGVVIVPSQEEKYIVPLTDTLPVSSDIYDIRPDYTYFYK